MLTWMDEMNISHSDLYDMEDADAQFAVWLQNKEKYERVIKDKDGKHNN